MTDPEIITLQGSESNGEFGHAGQTTGSRQHTPNRNWQFTGSKLPFMAWGGGGHHGIGAPPPPTQRRGVGPSLSAGAPPPSARPDPSYIYVAGTHKGTFFSTPRKKPNTRPDRSVSLDRLSKGIAVMGERSPRAGSRSSRTERSPSPSASPPRSAAHTLLNYSLPLRPSGSPPRSGAHTPLSSSRQSSASRLSPSRMSSVASAPSQQPRNLNQVNAWDRGVERFTSAPLKRQVSVSSVASECSRARSSSCQSERSQRILDESKYPRSNSLYSLHYSSPIEQLQAKRVLNESSDRWSEVSRREGCASVDAAQNKVPIMYRRHPRLQAMETMITPRVANDEVDGWQVDPRQNTQRACADLADGFERVERQKVQRVEQEVSALQAALAAADEKVMRHTQEIGAIQAALAASEEKASKAGASRGAVNGERMNRQGVNGHTLPAWLVSGRDAAPAPQPESGSSHQAKDVASPNLGRAPPICNGRLHQKLQGSVDTAITPRGVSNPPLSPCERPPFHLPGLDAARGDADAAGLLHSTRSLQSDDSKSIQSSTCANADAAAGPRENSKIFKWDVALEDDD